MKTILKIAFLCTLFSVFFISCQKDNSSSLKQNTFASKFKATNLSSTDNWTQLPGYGNDISVGADGSVFITDTTTVSATGGYAILKWNGTGWSTFAGAGVRLAVDPTGKPWVVNKSHLIYKYNGPLYQALPGTATDIGIGADGSAFICDTTTVTASTGFRVSKWNGTSWTVMSGIAGVRVAVDSTGTPWVVNKSNLIYKYNGSTWTLLPGTATDIGIGKNGAVYIVSATPVLASDGYVISKWNGSGWTATVSGVGINISVDPQGHPWTVNASYLIYNNLNL